MIYNSLYVLSKSCYTMTIHYDEHCQTATCTLYMFNWRIDSDKSNLWCYSFYVLRIIEMNVKKGTIEITNPAKKEEVPRMFTYDSVYDWKWVLHMYTITQVQVQVHIVLTCALEHPISPCMIRIDRRWLQLDAKYSGCHHKLLHQN